MHVTATSGATSGAELTLSAALSLGTTRHARVVVVSGSSGPARSINNTRLRLTRTGRRRYCLCWWSAFHRLMMSAVCFVRLSTVSFFPKNFTNSPSGAIRYMMMLWSIR